MRPSLAPAEPAPQPTTREKAATSAPEGSNEKPRWPVVVAAGDIACDPRAPTFNDGLGTFDSCRQGLTAELVERIDPDAVLVLGDDQYDDGTFRDYRRSYDPSWGKFKRISHPTPGDPRAGASLNGYYRYWDLRARPKALPWYSFSIGNWHVISLNSNCGAVGGCEPGSPQYDWLRADLAAHSGGCQIAFLHEPVFSSTASAATESLDSLWQALADARVEVLLSGDAHNYERFRKQDAGGLPTPDGVRQFVVGTGGESLTPFTKRSPGSARRNSTTFGVLKLTLRAKSYRWRFVPVPGAVFGDAGGGACH